MTLPRLLAALAQMEGWLDDPAWVPDEEVLAQWELRFQAALAEARQDPGWEPVQARAHQAGARLEARIVSVARARDQVKAELDGQERGVRALRGYGAHTR